MDATEMFLVRHPRMHARIGGLTEGLTDEQIRGHVHPDANPLAWLLWHMILSEDAAVNLLVTGGRQVLDTAWAGRLNVGRRDIGEGMTMAEVDQLCAAIDLSALAAYRAAVEKQTASVVGALTPAALDRALSPQDVRQAAVDEGMLAGPYVAQLVEEWTGMTRGYCLVYLPLTHNYEHIGQADLLRGLLGRPGSV
jgi:DinB superfamily